MLNLFSLIAIVGSTAAAVIVFGTHMGRENPWMRLLVGSAFIASGLAVLAL